MGQFFFFFLEESSESFQSMVGRSIQLWITSLPTTYTFYVLLTQLQKNHEVKTLFSIHALSTMITRIVKLTTHELTYILLNPKTICLHNANFSDVQSFHGDYLTIKPQNCSCSLLYIPWTFHLHSEWQGIYSVLKSILILLCVWKSNTWNQVIL